MTSSQWRVNSLSWISWNCKKWNGILFERAFLHTLIIKCCSTDPTHCCLGCPLIIVSLKVLPLEFISPNCEMQPCRRPTLLNLEHNSSPMDLYLDFVSSFISNQTTKKSPMSNFNCSINLSLDSNFNSDLNSVKDTYPSEGKKICISFKFEINMP